MEFLLKQLEEINEPLKTVMKRCCRSNKVSVSTVSMFTPLKLKKMWEKAIKIYVTNPVKSKKSWIENQLRAYNWVLIAYSVITNTLIKQFQPHDWERLTQIFKGKETSVLKYEATKLLTQDQNGKNWTQEEDKILRQIIIPHQDDNHWNNIARQLFANSDCVFFRSGRQCRERWLNHLDPSKTHGHWSPKEDYLICRSILQKGKKWAKIAHQLNNYRTEHMVKNRYKTIIIRAKKTGKTARQQEILQALVNSYGHQPINMIATHKENPLEYREMSPDHQEKHPNVSYLIIPEEIPHENLINCTKREYSQEEVQLEQGVGKDFVRYNNALTPTNQFEPNHVFTPIYINCAMTPNIFPVSPSMPFFFNSSFSYYQGNRDLFLRNTNCHQQKDK